MLSVEFVLFICSLSICVYCVHGDSRHIYFKDGGTGDEKVDLQENDGCNRTNGILWTCQKLKNCPEALDRVKKGEYPFICRFDQKEPIVCCKLAFIPDRPADGSILGSGSERDTPTVEKPQPLTEPKSTIMCNRYSTWLCGAQFLTSGNRLPTTWSGHTTVPWFAVIGGVNSKPKEFPHMYTLKPVSIVNINTVSVFMNPSDRCEPNGGTCLKIENCPLATEAIKRGERPETCGFDGSQPIVCCSDNKTVTKPEVSKPLNESKSQTKRLTFSQKFCENRLGIVGGTASHAKEFPHMALIGYGDEPEWLCGGTLISENFVLTAAHCTFPGPKVGLAKYVRIGDLNTASDADNARPQQFKIIERIDHPEYRPPLLYNDIALYRLDRNATFDDYVRPLCLYQSFSLPEEAGVATGWGRIEFAGPISKDLQKANLTYIDLVKCNKLLNATTQIPRGIDPKSMVCAGESDGSKDTCQGDSGGPLAVQKHLQRTCLAAQVGITSFGRQCGLPNSPGVYTRVAHFIPWIESIVWPGPV